MLNPRKETCWVLTEKLHATRLQITVRDALLLNPRKKLAGVG